jgi:hypothetical protein
MVRPQHNLDTQLLQQKGMAVYGANGLKIGTLNGEHRDGYIVLTTGMFFNRKVMAIPVSAVAGTDVHHIYLKYTKDEIESGYPELAMQHPIPGTPLGEAQREPVAQLEHDIYDANLPGPGDQHNQHMNS